MKVAVVAFWGQHVRICYVDESGCPGALPSSTSDVQPALVVLALVISAVDLPFLTQEFLKLKGDFFPGSMPRSGFFLDRITAEIKGSDLRRNICFGHRRARRTSIGFLDKTLDLAERYNIRIWGRIWIKGIAAPFDGRAVYTSSVQRLFEHLERHLEEVDDDGFVIADSRNKGLNVPVAHSIFTEKHRARGDKYRRVLELPTFGHSDNHVGLQIADFIASSLLYPMAIHTYCEGCVTNIHVRPEYQRIKARYAERLNSLQYHYYVDEKLVRGISVSDGLRQYPSRRLFEP